MAFEGKGLAIAGLVLGIALTFLSLYLIARNMLRVLAGNVERAMNRALESSGVVPMCAAGVLSLPNAFPVMLGANIGTTVTAILARMAQEKPEALTIALVHLLFNLGAVTW